MRKNQECRRSHATRGQRQGGVLHHISQQGENWRGGTFLQRAQDVSFSAFPLLEKKKVLQKRLKYRCWESSSGPHLLDSIRKHQRVTVDILWLSDKYVPMKKPYGDSDLQLDRVFTEVETSFQQNPNSKTKQYKTQNTQKEKGKKNKLQPFLSSFSPLIKR